jgi:hypothetical protein
LFYLWFNGIYVIGCIRKKYFLRCKIRIGFNYLFTGIKGTV